MAMDLNKSCHHCDAPIGVICSVLCSVNGDKVKNLIFSLKELDLDVSNLNLSIHGIEKDE